MSFWKEREYQLFQTVGYYYNYDVYHKGDTVKYSYSYEQKSYSLRNDSLKISFQLNLESNPHYEGPMRKFVMDILHIIYWDTIPPLYGNQVFFDIVALRTVPYPWETILIPEKEILGKIFYDIVDIVIGMPKSIVYFNYQFGIVSFTDKQNKQWRFESFN